MVVIEPRVFNLPAGLPVLFASGTVMAEMLHVCSATVSGDHLCAIFSSRLVNLDEIFLQHPTAVVFSTIRHIVVRICKIITEGHISRQLLSFGIVPLHITATVAFHTLWTRRGLVRPWIFCSRHLRNRVCTVASVTATKADLGIKNGDIALPMVVIEPRVFNLPAGLPVLFASGTVMAEMLHVCSATVSGDHLCAIFSSRLVNLDEIFLQHPTAVVFSTIRHIVVRICKIITEGHISRQLLSFGIVPLHITATVAFHTLWARGGVVGPWPWGISWDIWIRHHWHILVALVLVAEADICKCCAVLRNVGVRYVETLVLCARPTFANELVVIGELLGELFLTAVPHLNLDEFWFPICRLGDKKLANNATAFALVRAADHPVTHHCLVPALWSAVCHWVLFIGSALLPAVDQVATVVALRSSISKI